MPELDGYAATRAIRQREQEQGLARMPIIAMTAHAMWGDRDICLAAGMDAYLTKPIQIEVLNETLSHWLSSDTAQQTPAPEPHKADDACKSPSDPLPTIDRQRLDELRELMGDNLFMALEAFSEATSQRLEALHQAADDGDETALFHIAHTVKGSSSNLGVMALSDLCTDLVECCRAGTLADAVQQVARLEAEFAQVQVSLQLLCQEYVPEGSQNV